MISLSTRLTATRLPTHMSARIPRLSALRKPLFLSVSLSAPCRLYQTQIPRRIPTTPPRSNPALAHLTRPFSTTRIQSHGHITPPKPGEELYITFIDKDDQSYKFAVSAGDNLLDIAQANDLEMEGACGGSCACSTCHVIVTDEAYFDRIPEPNDDENDMLDLAFGLTETSRLGCQVTMTKELDGLTVRLPAMTRNFQASDFQ